MPCSIDKNKQTDLIILDFSKAFDRVPHQRLLGKLDFYGIRGRIYNWIKSFLSSRNQQVGTLKCLSIGTPKAIYFPFVSNEKVMFLGVPVFKHIEMRL